MSRESYVLVKNVRNIHTKYAGAFGASGFSKVLTPVNAQVPQLYGNGPYWSAFKNGVKYGLKCSGILRRRNVN